MYCGVMSNQDLNLKLNYCLTTDNHDTILDFAHLKNTRNEVDIY